MYELSLFSGAGGGLLATKYLLGWECIGYVEIDDYCQRVLAQRIRDGLLDNAPIFGDIRAFLSEGYAERYRGVADVITAGFPCQPFSVAGQQKGDKDERNLWPQTRDAISVVRPRYVLLENVPGLLAHEYIWTILSEITAMGYDCRWGIISAKDAGAPHLRKRWWLVAYSNTERLEGSKSKSIIRLVKVDNMAFPQYFPQSLNDLPQPIVFGTGHGVANYVDRIRAIGNGQVPQCVKMAWEILKVKL